ncbi:enoyl-CoA hydratase/isomerase family protein [Prauserella halophila]|uniref:Enoyl-CoA hydratase/isomerase family protein n=1 Tax=Prauserella halophila TaxID=185641 RepID=A0ABP4H3I9_9PSEU|nr:enoyl-CoA hydratase/isomerase family protein [Prauserella halophila]MCP2238176.1 enoyl-CoA hydratase [Prauserella halophila]
MSAVLTERTGAVLLITVNAPEKRNALDYEANEALIAAFTEFQADETLRVAVVTGADGAFCSGADLKTFSPRYVGEPAPYFRERFVDGYGFGGITRGLRVTKPIISAINGYAISGGLELALATDIRFCAPDAVFAIHDVNRGMHPCDGGCVRLPHIVGLGNAMEIILSGDRIGAEHALRIGLVNRIIPQADLVAETLRFAEVLATRGPLAQRYMKDVARRSAGLSLNEAVRLEVNSFADLAHSEDRAEGNAAFHERRPARFVGR